MNESLIFLCPESALSQMQTVRWTQGGAHWLGLHLKAITSCTEALTRSRWALSKAVLCTWLPPLQNAEWQFYWYRMKAWPFRFENGAPCLISLGQQLWLPPFANQNDSKLQPESVCWRCGARTTWLTNEDAAKGAAKQDKEARSVCLESEVRQGDGRESRKCKYQKYSMFKNFLFVMLILGGMAHFTSLTRRKKKYFTISVDDTTNQMSQTGDSWAKTST